MLVTNTTADTVSSERIEDDLSRIRIDQLHRATLTFSNNSQETKKLCVSLDVSALTVLAGFDLQGLASAESTGSLKLSSSVLLVGIVIPLAFLLVDSFLYFYQASLRSRMNREFDAIRVRHEIEPSGSNKDSQPLATIIIKSVINGSQTIYYVLILVAVVLGIMLKFIWEV